MTTTIKHRQIKNRDLTGASFDSELKFYDETQGYSANDIVFYAGRFYKATQTIPATVEGDLQYSPTNKPDNWQDITYELLFKQREVTINSVGDVFSIQLENPNDTFMKHCFILKYNAPQSNITQPIANFDSNEVMWDYDTDWVILDGTLRLKTSKTYDMSKVNNGNIDIYEKQINSNDYEDMQSITITISD